MSLRWLLRRRPATSIVPVVVPVVGPVGVLAEVRGAREQVAARVASMAQTGALDSGNGDALDGWLERLRSSWHARLADERARSVANTEARLERLRADALETELTATAAKAEVDDTRSAMEAVREGIFGPATEPAPPRERRRRPRATSDPLEGLVRHGWSTLILYSLLGLAAAGDVATFYLVLAGAFANGGPVVVWLLTAAFSAASVGLMHCVGRALRSLRGAHGGLGRVAILLMTLGWLGLGGVAVFFRSQEATFGGAAGPVFGDPAAQAAAEIAAAQEALLSAVLLAGLFLASGLLAFYTGYSEHHPRTSSYRSLWKRLVKQQKAHVKAATAAVHAKEALRHALEEPTRALRRETAGLAEADAMIDELKELVRVLVAETMGLPEATNGLTTGRSPAPSDRLASVGVLDEIPLPRTESAPAQQRAGRGSHDVLWPLVPVSAAEAASNGHGPSNGHDPSHPHGADDGGPA